jgi:YbbR domain-containing protein
MAVLGTTTGIFKSVRLKIKAFLNSQRWREALIFFCFVLLSFGFWMLQSLQEEYEMEIVIPVSYFNVPPAISFDRTLPTHITVRIRDKGSVLLNYKFGHTFIPIEADMKSTIQKSGKLTISRQFIENRIKRQLISTTTLLSFEPRSIDESYSERLEKDLPVVFDGSIQTNAGHKVSGDIQILPSTVQVYANNSVLDTLSCVYTVFTVINKGENNISRRIRIKSISGASIRPSIVSVTIPIEEYTEKTLSIPIVCPDLPPHYTLRTFPSIAKVNCSVPLSQFKNVSSDDFAIQISFIDLEQNVTGSLPIQLTKKPDWVDITTITPGKIEFILEETKAQ